MFDTAKLRTLAMEAHPPAAVFLMLAALALVSALLAGFGMSRGRRSWMHITVFAIVMAGSVYIIMDLEYPRSSLIQIRAFDQALMDVRAGMGQVKTDG